MSGSNKVALTRSASARRAAAMRSSRCTTRGRDYTVRLYPSMAHIKGGKDPAFSFANFTRFADGNWTR